LAVTEDSPGTETEPSPEPGTPGAETAPLRDAADPEASRRGAAILFYAGGVLSGALVAVLALSLVGVSAKNEEGGSALASGSASGTAPPSGSFESAAPTGGSLVTPPPVVAPAALTPTALADGHALGSSDAPVTVEVWADYQCPYCARFSAEVEPQIIEDYVTDGKVRLVFRDLAFLGDESRWAAVAARLAEQQDRFWPFHDYLFANQLGENTGSFSVERLQQIATAAGLDRTTFDAGLALEPARTLFAQIQSESETDAGKLGIHATPSVVVDGKLLDGNDWATVQAAIEAALAG